MATKLPAIASTTKPKTAPPCSTQQILAPSQPSSCKKGTKIKTKTSQITGSISTIPCGKAMQTLVRFQQWKNSITKVLPSLHLISSTLKWRARLWVKSFKTSIIITIRSTQGRSIRFTMKWYLRAGAPPPTTIYCHWRIRWLSSRNLIKGRLKARLRTKSEAFNWSRTRQLE